MIRYRVLAADEIDPALLAGFHRRQVVTKCLRKVDGLWVVVDDPFIDDWTEADRVDRAAKIRRTAETGGYVAGAFEGGALKGFVTVESSFFGAAREYLDLSRLHVSEDMRGRGVGRALFDAAKCWAAAQGARKLYISAHSAAETQAFYRAMGCVEAAEYDPKHVEKEPCDCQMECAL